MRPIPYGIQYTLRRFAASEAAMIDLYAWSTPIDREL